MSGAEWSYAVLFALNKALLDRELRKLVNVPNFRIDEETVGKAERLLRQAKANGATNLEAYVSSHAQPVLFVAYWKMITEGTTTNLSYWNPLFDYLTGKASDDEKSGVFQTVLGAYLSSQYGADLCRKVLDLLEDSPVIIFNMAISHLANVVGESAKTIVRRILAVERRIGAGNLPFLNELASAADGVSRISQMAKECKGKSALVGRLRIALSCSVKGSKDVVHLAKLAEAILAICLENILQVETNGEREIGSREWAVSLGAIPVSADSSFAPVVSQVLALYVGLSSGSLTNLPANADDKQFISKAVFTLLCQMCFCPKVLDYVFPFLNTRPVGYANREDFLASLRQRFNVNRANLTHLNDCFYCFQSALASEVGASRLRKLISNNPTGAFVETLSVCAVTGHFSSLSQPNVRTWGSCAGGLYDISSKLVGEVRKGIMKLTFLLAAPSGCLNKVILRGESPALLEECLDISPQDLEGKVGLQNLILSLSEVQGDTCSIYGNEAFTILSQEGFVYLGGRRVKRFWRLDSSFLERHLKGMRSGPKGQVAYAMSILKRSKEDERIRQDRPLMFACLVNIATDFLGQGRKLSAIYDYLSQNEMIAILCDAHELGLQYAKTEAVARWWQKMALDVVNQAGKLF